jgi:D-alanyl-D-alanine carboxypeptidase
MNPRRSAVRSIVCVCAALGIVCGAAAVPAAAAESPAPIAPAVAAKLDAIVAASVSNTPGTAPAVSIAVVENGKLAYARAAGLEDVAAKRAATTRTRFRIASITKMFTAVCVLQLVDAGKLKLDDPLAAILPALPHAREVTIRQLLMHTSGIPNYGDAAFADGSVTHKTTPAAIVASMLRKPLEFAPGTKYAYSNTGYVLLGLVVEKLARTPLAAYETTHIFGPAGMRETGAGDPPPGPGIATGYADAEATPVPKYDASWLYADGDIISTAADVARFDIALMRGTLVRPQTFALMREHPVETPEAGARYGLGVSLFPLADLTFAGHHGGLPGFAADNEMLPDQGFAVVVFGNAFSFSTAKLTGPLLATLFPATSARAVAERQAEALVVAPGEDPAITERLRTFFTALQNGRVDRAAVSDQMNAQLTAENLGAVAAQLDVLGTLQTLVYRSKDDQLLGTVYHYTGVFSKQTTPMTFSIDKNDKIAGVFLQ